jgi:hypothetical protein
MSDIVPLISSCTKGPLGACHLPRLWLKMLLSALGRLPEGYRAGSGGFDADTIENLGIPADDFKHYIDSVMPNYLECEAWVRAHATKIDAASIAKHNDYILNRDKSEEKAADQRKDIGELAPDTRNAVTLNDLDDWTIMHRHLVPERATAG